MVTGTETTMKVGRHRLGIKEIQGVRQNVVAC